MNVTGKYSFVYVSVPNEYSIHAMAIYLETGDVQKSL